MKIIFIITSSDLSGAPVHLLSIVEHMKARGNQLLVVFGKNGEVSEKIESMGICVEYLKSIKSNFNILQDISSVYYLVRLMKCFNPDIVHLHSTKSGFVGRLAAGIMRKRCIYTIHGWGFGKGHPFIQSIFVFMCEFLLKNLVSKYIAVSNYDRKYGIKWLAIPESKIETIYNGVKNVHTKNRDDSKFTCIMVARNDSQKDYETFLMALKYSKFDSAILVGRGTDDIALVKRAAEILGEKFRKVRFLGVRKDVYQLLEESSVFVLTTKYEGLPISIIEAMSKSLPIIATDVGGISEMVFPNKNGFLVKRFDYGAVSNSLNKLYYQKKIRDRMGVFSRDLFESKFNEDQMNFLTLKIYN